MVELVADELVVLFALSSGCSELVFHSISLRRDEFLGEISEMTLHLYGRVVVLLF